MTPRARQSDIETPATENMMAHSIITGAATIRTRPANDVTAEGRQNLLVRRRRRLTRREAH